MTKPIPPRLHGVLDYVVVTVFLLAPALFGLTGLAAMLSYLLAGVHLLMTVLTAFPLGLTAVVPFALHGTVELVVGGVLAVVALLLFEGAATGFYLGMGVLILIVWALTDYRSTDYRSPATA